MRLKCICIVIIMILFIVMPFTLSSAASGITLDGSFNDWTDKPTLDDKHGDEIPSQDLICVKWYPDISNGSLYFYAERLSGVDENKSNQYEDWELNVFLSGDKDQRKATIDFHPPSQFVQVTLYDSKGKYLWSEKGKWGDGKDPGTRIEFEIPLGYIVSSITSGYQVSSYFTSGSDRAPDEGIISISTISTFPLQTMFGVGIVCLVLFVIFRKRMLRMKRV